MRHSIQNLRLPQDAAYCALVEGLWRHPAVQSMNGYLQHGATTCLQHCLHVSYLSYRYCIRHGLDARAAARGGLLHDLFLYDWHTYRRPKGERLHGFAHPRKALDNAKRFFELTPGEEAIILQHMWPLTRTFPTTPEARVVMIMDKYAGFLETVCRRPPGVPAGWLWRLPEMWG